MIRRLEEYAQALADAAATAPHPGLLAALWKRTAGGLPGGLTVYDCGGGLLLAVRRGAAVLLGEPTAAARQEITAFARFAGIRYLYTAGSVSFSGWKAKPLVWMACPVDRTAPPAATPHTVAPLNGYSAAAQLVCGEECEEVRNDFYAELCSRRNRGIGQVLAIGDPALEACLVCSGPIPCPPPSAACTLPVQNTGTGCLRPLLRRLRKLPLLQKLALLRKQAVPAQPPEAPAALLPTVYLSDLFTAPAYRRARRGEALIDAAKRGEGLPPETQQLVLYCAPELAPYYETLGFIPGGTLRRWQTAD